MSWEDKVRKVVPYVPGEQPRMTNMIKLNTNECPYPPSPAVERELAVIGRQELRLYPDTEATDLACSIAGKYHLDSSQVFVGVGSDDVIAQIFLTFFTGGGTLYFPDVTYSFYKVWADLYRIPYKEVPLSDDWQILPGDYNDGLDKAGIIFPNPNAPTGLLMEEGGVEEILKGNPECLVVVDEAYIDFAGNSAAELLNKYDNLMVVQTFSKSRDMAGARIGYAMGSKKLIEALKAVKFSINSYTMSTMAIRLGVAAFRDEEYFKQITGKIISTRERSKQRLRDLGFSFPDSSANFIFAKHKSVPGKELFEYLKSQNIFIRRFDDERIKDYLRITIGTDEQMDKVLDALEVYL